MKFRYMCLHIQIYMHLVCAKVSYTIYFVLLCSASFFSHMGGGRSSPHGAGGLLPEMLQVLSCWGMTLGRSPQNSSPLSHLLVPSELSRQLSTSSTGLLWSSSFRIKNVSLKQQWQWACQLKWRLECQGWGSVVEHLLGMYEAPDLVSWENLWRLL